ncbi:TrbG/VirB9 family P-type conjugative transfer protein [Cellvibrio sp. OA-2007]|uniref:TrbG/VirB9 family P-type conjugative transfer protein n=1 Tax=Cellvibrio sp. OA-2007 TaxID=529823 RepID=UPI00078095DE|nr:TrbG/VirB9 family P-type conjugative transfer protein [Cellvibrio sp. OA-2007]
MGFQTDRNILFSGSVAFGCFIIFVCVAFSSPYAIGAVVPNGSAFDPRIQSVMYNPDDVTVIRTRTGNSTLIQLEKGEVVDGVREGGLSFGDTGAWTVGVREHNIFIKPKAPFPNTNINIVTNKRTYSISLVDVPNITDAAWQVRFKYPAPPEPPKKIVHPDLGPCSDGPKNLNWFKYGHQVLSPTEVWDDGRFTCFRFPTSKALPVVYRYTPGSELKEALVNFHIKDDVVVVHEVASEFRLRLGERVLGVKTDSLRDAPFNERKTTTGETRVRLDDK